MSDEDYLDVFFLFDRDVNMLWFGLHSEGDAEGLLLPNLSLLKKRVHKSELGYCTYHDPTWKDKLIVRYDCLHKCGGKGEHKFYCCECKHYKQIGSWSVDNVIRRV